MDHQSTSDHDIEVMSVQGDEQDASNLRPDCTAAGQDLSGGLGPYRRLFPSIRLGAHSFYEATRELNLRDDNVAVINNNADHYVKAVYDALTETPSEDGGYSEFKQQMVRDFEKKLSLFERPEITLIEVSYVVIDCVINLHTDGDNLREDQMEPLRASKEDLDMKAVDRISVMLKILKDTKRVGIDLLEGKDTVTRFVAAPRAYNKRKYANKKCNLKRDAVIARGRAARANAGPPASPGAPTSTPNALNQAATSEDDAEHESDVEDY